MGNKRKKKLQTQVGKYLKGPLYFIAFWIMINVITYAIDVRAGVVMSLATFVYIILMLSIAIKYNSNVTKRLIDFGSAYSLVQRQMLKERMCHMALLTKTERYYGLTTSLILYLKRVF